MRHERFEHGPLVEAWLKEPTFLAETDLARVARLVHQTPQRRSWLPQLGDTRFKTMLSATTITAGVAVIALTGSVLLDGLSPHGPAPNQVPAAGADASIVALPSPATVTAEPDAADTPVAVGITQGIERGTFDTPAGPASWLRVTRAYGELPRLYDAVPWNGGIGIWDAGWRADDGDEGSGLWETTDGIEWQKVPLPMPVKRDDGSDNLVAAHIGDVALLFEPRGERLWRSTGEGGWEELDTSALTAVRPKGWWTSDPTIEGPRLVGGQQVMDVEWVYRLPRQQLGIPRQAGGRTLERLNDGRYVLCNPDRNNCSANDAPAVLRFKETDDGLVVRDDRTGERLGRLAGAKASELHTGWGAARNQAFVVEGDALVPVGLPTDGPIEGAVQEEPTDAPAEWVESFDAGWLAHEVSSANRHVTSGSWLHLGDGWIDLGPAGYPPLQAYITAWSAASVGDTTLLWAEEAAEYGDYSTLWMITAPDGS